MQKWISIERSSTVCDHGLNGLSPLAVAASGKVLSTVWFAHATTSSTQVCLNNASELLLLVTRITQYAGIL
jgi:hypothetical protein